MTSPLPKDLRSHLERAFTFIRADQPEKAIDSLRQSLVELPYVAELHNNLGSLLGGSSKDIEAFECFRRAVELRPHYPQAHNNLGAVLEQMQDFEGAKRAYRHAIKLRAYYPEAYVNLSNVLRKLHRPAEAIRAAHEATRLRGEHPQTLNSLASALLEQGDVAQATQHLRRALQLAPQYAAAHSNFARALLIAGNYEEGWQHYAWRCERRTVSHTPQLWRGWVNANLAQKTVLVRGEGGLGHVIQFARYIPLIAARGGKVTFECQPPLVPLIRGVEGVTDVIGQGDEWPKADIAVPLRCLPQLFGTTLQTIPSPTEYLAPNAQVVDAMRTRLVGLDGLRIGVCWQGAQHSAEMRDRSFDSSNLLPISGIRGVNLVNLQLGAQPDRDLKLIQVPEFGKEPDAMMVTAALIKSLDLVITCDTSIAHLAGALGVPVWVALRFAADWRYMQNGDICPWYSTMRLFRQGTKRQWDEVFPRLAQELARGMSVGTRKQG